MSRRVHVVAAAALVACSAGCGPAPGTQPSGTFDVYVPGSPDGGDAAVTDATSPLEAGEAGPTRVDRAARPLVAVLLVPPSLQDDYNGLGSFDGDLPRVLAEAMQSRLVELDTLVVDGGADPVDWPVPEGGTHPLVPVFGSDWLLVDTGKSCTTPDAGFAKSYLDLEAELFLGGPAHGTCGGRTPAEDVTDKSLTLWIAGERDGGTPVTQGVSGPTRAPSTSFPYLAPPQ